VNADATRLLARMDVITLAELVDRADLQTRRDRKYMVPIASLAGLLSEGARGGRVLEVNRLRGFDYESVYFDTPDLVSYYGAARRRPSRFKVRTRSYMDSNECVLEIKTRDGSGRTVKHRTAHPFSKRGELGESDRQSILSVPAAAASASSLEVAMVVRYRRSTLTLNGELVRVTIDTDLTWHVPESKNRSLPGVVLVETKTLGPPSAFDRSLWRQGFRPVVFSKYCTGLAALRPELPANKWNRPLRRFFDWEPSRTGDRESAVEGVARSAIVVAS
jgi:hypothetical protein